MTFGCFLTPSLMLLAVIPAPAAIVIVPFSGMINQASDPSKTLANARINDPITGYLSYSTAPGDHSGRRYSGTIQITLGGQSILLTTSLNFLDFSYDNLGNTASFSFGFDSNGPTNTAPLYIYGLSVSLWDETATNVTTGTTPPDHLSVLDFTRGTWRLSGALLDRTGSFNYSGIIAVPEASVLGTILLGLPSLLRRRR